MKLSIRQHVANNFKKLDTLEIKSSIEEGIKNENEVVLPGLGVLFEVVYSNSSKKMQDEIIDCIKNNI